MWLSKRSNNGDRTKITMGYHKAIKRLAGMHVWESNHASCEKIDAHIFEHLMNKRLLKFHLDVINSRYTFIPTVFLFFYNHY